MMFKKCEVLNAYETIDKKYIIKKSKHKSWVVYEKINGEEFYEKNGMEKANLAEAKKLVLKLFYKIEI